MKLIFAVINNDDSHKVSTELTKNGFSATKLASTGGFLMSGNSTEDMEVFRRYGIEL